jgi:hypothetical protein
LQDVLFIYHLYSKGAILRPFEILRTSAARSLFFFLVKEAKIIRNDFYALKRRELITMGFKYILVVIEAEFT